MHDERLIIVEGGSDRKRIRTILSEPVEIICTNGTVSSYQLEELMQSYEEREVFVFLDADLSGEKIRSLFKREHPNVSHLYTEKEYGEVETTPYKVLAQILQQAGFQIRCQFLE